MSSDFQKVLVKDDRLHVTDSVRYAVVKGPQNNTMSQFRAVSEGATSHVYNIQVPSEQTLLDRRVLWQSTATVQVQVVCGASTPAGLNLFDYGNRVALSAFPLQSMTSTMTATINNNSVTINQQDTLPIINRMLDRHELARYNGYCPNAYDTTKNYSDAVGSNANVLGSWIQSTDNDLNPRGSWVLDSVTAPAGGLVTAGGAQTITFTVTFTSTEPLLLSPFIYADPKSNNQAIYGIQNLNFQFNMQPTNRALRFAGFPGVSSLSYTVTPLSFNNSQLLLNFLTPHPSDLIPARNVVPYYELPRYISNSQPALPAVAGGVPGKATFSSQSLQLNQIPDKLFIFVRKALGSQTPTDSDFFIPITSVRINWNNQSGILSSALSQDLYQMTIQNGANLSWYEFSGRANVSSAIPYPAGATTPGDYIVTAGGFLCLEFGKDIQITEDFYAPGSLGNFNLQVLIDVVNWDDVAYSAGALEMVIITMNSGVFVCERGTSASYLGILTKSDVLDASSQEAYTASDVERMVGGGFLDSLKSVAGMVAPKALPVAKALLGSMDNPYAKTGAEVLGALGFAKPRGKLMDRIA